MKGSRIADMTIKAIRNLLLEDPESSS